MARGEKDQYTDKQKRKAEHIADSYGERGVTKKVAKARAWATVNKESGAGNKSGKPDATASAPAGGRKTAARTAAKRSAAKKTTRTAAKQTSTSTRDERRSAAARKGWETRRQRSGAASKVRKTAARKQASR